MKKVCLILVGLLLCFSFAGISGCADNSRENNVPTTYDLSKIEVGTEMPIYPAFEFDYKVNDDLIIRISSMSVTLTEKNEINPGDIIEGDYNFFTLMAKIHGSVITNNKNQRFYIAIYAPYFSQTCIAEVDSLGNFICKQEFAISSVIVNFSFYSANTF